MALSLLRNYKLRRKFQEKCEEITPKDLFSFIACSLMILWGPIQFWILGFDGAGRTPRFILICTFLVSFYSIKKTSFKKPILLYILLGIYMFLNGFIKGGENSFLKDGIYVLFCDALTGPFMLLILVNLFHKYFDKSLKIFTWVLYAYTILFAIFSDFEEKAGFIRLNGAINANEGALHIAICFFLILLLFIKEKLTLFQTFILSILPLWVILQTGSRMAVVICILAIFATIFIKSDLKKNKFKIFLGLGLLILGTMFILKNTMIGERLSSTTTQAEEATWATGTAWDVLGDRGIAFYYSWPYFIKQPITGIGFQNWGMENPYGIRAHSEYLVMYLENGIIGFFIFSYIMFLFIQALYQQRKLSSNNIMMKHIATFLMTILILILIADTMLWTFNEYGVFIIYAMCYSLSPNLNNQIAKS